MACFPKEIESLAQGANVVTTSCAWCGRVKSADGEWGAAQPSELLHDTKSHGICPECLASEMYGGNTGGEKQRDED